MSVEISRVVFVDQIFGNDETGQLDNLTFPFQTFDAAYAAALSTQQTYTISLASGFYRADQFNYQNINVESTTGLDSNNPNVFITPSVKEWDGVIWNDINVCIGVDVQTFREPIEIIGASSISRNANLIIDNTSSLEKLFALPLQTMKEYLSERKSSYPQRMEEILPEIKERRKISPRVPVPADIRALFVSKRAFELLSPPIIVAQIIPMFALLDNETLALIGLPDLSDNRAVANFVVTIVRQLASVIFDGLGRKEKSAIWYLLDPEVLCPILGIYESVDFFTLVPIILKELDLTINVPGLEDIFNLLFYALEPENETNGMNKTNEMNKVNLIEENPIAQMIQARVESEIERQNQEVQNRLTEASNLPEISIIDSSITYGSSLNNSPISILNNEREKYFINNSTLSNIILPEEDLVNTIVGSHEESEENGMDLTNSIYPVIETGGSEGSEILRGSRFERYRCINDDYIHQEFDGEEFLVDGSKGNILIEIPDVWDGRVFSYVRTDRTENKVKIKNRNGKFDGCSHRILLKKRLKFIIVENGNSYIY